MHLNARPKNLKLIQIKIRKNARGGPEGPTDGHIILPLKSSFPVELDVSLPQDVC